MRAAERRWSAAALGVAPLALLATGGWMRAARGPSWLALNFDPPYAYLLNSLAILKGDPPFLIQHPGVPLQSIGSLAIALRHAATGPGALAQDVIAQPETYILWIYWSALVVSAALVATAGVVVWRRAGLAAALLVQAGPWSSVVAGSLIGQLRADAMIAGTAAMWTAYLVAHVARPSRSTAVRLGVMTGLTICLHLSALPLLVGPLLLLDGTRDRARFLAATIGAFLIAFLPAWLKLASFAKYVVMMTFHSGHYGTGPATIIDVRGYVPAVRMLLAAEPLASVIIVASAAVWAAWTFGGRVSGPDLVMRRGLGALVVTDVVCLSLTAKHPDAHYLVPMLCTLGGNLWLMGRFIGARARAPSAGGGGGARRDRGRPGGRVASRGVRPADATRRTGSVGAEPGSDRRPRSLFSALRVSRVGGGTGARVGQHHGPVQRAAPLRPRDCSAVSTIRLRRRSAPVARRRLEAARSGGSAWAGGMRGVFAGDGGDAPRALSGTARSPRHFRFRDPLSGQAGAVVV